MSRAPINYHSIPEPKGSVLREEHVEYGFPTGSGKTLTSFKENEHIHKCLFVVNRKDLERQTREELNRFQDVCVEENTNTCALVQSFFSGNRQNKITGKNKRIVSTKRRANFHWSRSAAFVVAHGCMSYNLN